MTTPTEDLVDRLARQLTALADEAPAARPEPGLWARGRRYQRLRRGGTVLIAAAACLALVLLGTVVERRDADPVPAPAGASVGLPDRFFTPSPWLPGTDDAGPLGQLVAVRQAERSGWSGTREGVVGISATTGEYRFLDLPDRAGGTSAALSPDGLHLAYWLTGETTGTPYTTEGDVITGIAVLDTATGDVARHEIASEHGLGEDTLLWVSAETLAFGAGKADFAADDPDQGGLFRSGTLQAWTLGKSPRDVPGVDDRSWFDPPVSGGRLLIEGRAGRYQVVDPTRGPITTIIAARVHLPLVDPTGTRVAALHQGPSAQNPNKLVLGPLVPSGEGRGPGRTSTARLSPIPGTHGTYELLAWSDEQHLIVLRRNGRVVDSGVLAEVDVTTGDTQILSRFGDSGAPSPTELATDLLSAPVVEAQAPPRPMDPRWVTALATAGLLAGVGGIIWWRRRVRP